MFDWKDDGMFGWNYRYLFFHFWIIPGELYRRAKWFVQRGLRGYSDADAWDLHSYLSKVIPGAIRSLDKHCCPVLMFSDEQLSRAEALTDEECDAARKKWDQITEDMALGFDAVYALNEKLPLPDTDRAKELKAQRDKGLALFVEYFECLWD